MIAAWTQPPQLVRVLHPLQAPARCSPAAVTGADCGCGFVSPMTMNVIVTTSEICACRRPYRYHGLLLLLLFHPGPELSYPEHQRL